ncbi:MAG: hypothetical protein JWQ97_3903 [Phenylobacterium sp.]|nr:hypothetical protein [Phenylobacterium sp.]
MDVLSLLAGAYLMGALFTAFVVVNRGSDYPVLLRVGMIVLWPLTWALAVLDWLVLSGR